MLLALTVGLASSVLVAGAVPSSASASNPHRAAVIVDTGTTVHRVVITFTEDSISGIDALQRAGANPVVYAMGPGAAVCRVYGVGRDPGSDCLGGQDGDNRYWAYFRAPAGSSGFTYSSIGAGTVRVHDGDVEGWKWGTGTAPAYVSLATLSPPPPPATQPPATAPATAAPGAAPRGDDGSARASTPGGVVGRAPGASTAPVTGAPVAGSTTTRGTAKDDSKRRPVDHATDENGKPIDPKLASAENDDGGAGTSAWSLLLLVALLVAIAVAILIVRRARRQGA
ncbi:MAG TPA: hypothetical protein VGN59_13320 [Acidimicrobiia bacterium]